MPKQNPYLIKENYKKVEEIREIDYRVPSYEEFMKNYEQGNMNYDDLGGGDIGETKGYGPCSSSSCSYSCRFYLKMGFDNMKWVFNELYEGGGRHFDWIVAENVEEARNILRKFENGKHNVDYRSDRDDWGRPTYGSQKKKREVMIKLENFIDSHERGNKVYEPLLKIYGDPDPSENGDSGICNPS